jgi:ferredoxin
MQDRLAQLTHSEACMECGACQINCPTDALVVESGVGCAAAMMRAALIRQKKVACG